MSSHVDGLTAMVMVHHAKPEDMVTFSDSGTHRYHYTYCMRHLEEVVHRHRQRSDKDCVMYAPDELERMIARDDLQDHLRRDRYRLYAIEAPTDNTWHRCPHCRQEAKHRGR